MTLERGQAPYHSIAPPQKPNTVNACLTQRHPDARTVDAGNTIVDPRFRGRQLVIRLGLHLNELCANEGFLGYHHYPTTAHAIMQELSVADEGTETGVMLAYIPAGTEYRELEGKPLAERSAVTSPASTPTCRRSRLLPGEVAGWLRGSGSSR